MGFVTLGISWSYFATKVVVSGFAPVPLTSVIIDSSGTHCAYILTIPPFAEVNLVTAARLVIYVPVPSAFKFHSYHLYGFFLIFSEFFNYSKL